MTSDQTQRITLSCQVDDQTTIGFADRRALSSSERMGRAGKVFGILFAVGLGTIVVPLLHLVLPPLFWLAALFFAATTYLETAMILGGEIACPNCQAVMKFPREAEEWPQERRCGGCSYMLTIKPVSI